MSIDQIFAVLLALWLVAVAALIVVTTNPSPASGTSVTTIEN